MTNTTMSPYDEETDRAAKRGWRPADAHTCPHVIAGGNCQADVNVVCLCQRHHHALDHARTWHDRDGQLILTGEPYDISGGNLSAFIFDCALLDLRVSISGRSMWYPGSTLLLIIRKDNTDKEPPQ